MGQSPSERPTVPQPPVPQQAGLEATTPLPPRPTVLPGPAYVPPPPTHQPLLPEPEGFALPLQGPQFLPAAG
ncbi:hypothetical protein GXW82_24735 [Streptacidiphilus sp. 4-A2]|nr:hypothetical protein [Streptacidiphilus sp. 4-A2]